MKNDEIVQLYLSGTFAAFCYMFIVYLGGYNSQTTEDIKLKGSSFLSCVEFTKCVKFYMSRFKGFKVGIFRKSLIDQCLNTFEIRIERNF